MVYENRMFETRAPYERATLRFIDPREALARHLVETERSTPSNGGVMALMKMRQRTAECDAPRGAIALDVARVRQLLAEIS